MSRRNRQMAVVLTGAVVLASGAYAVGSQSGQGSADAQSAAAKKRARHGFRRGPDGPGLGALAAKLGVDQSKLKAALDAMRAAGPPGGADPRAGFIKDFAAAIGLPEAKVKAAFDSVGPPGGPGGPGERRGYRRGGHRGAFAADLAKGLGLKTADVQAALDKLRPTRPPGPGGPGADFPAALAKELGVDASAVQSALDKIRAAHPMDGPGGRHGPMGGPGGPPPGGPPMNGARRRSPDGPPTAVISKLAKALGVNDSDVTAAFAKLRSQHDAQETARRDAFAADLAKRLGLDVSKVKDALASVGPGPHDERRAP